MGKKAFKSAIYRNGEICELINLCDIKQDLYQKTYRGHLFCPNNDCGARLKFVSRKNGAVSILQSINIHEHIDGCKFYFEYKKYDTDEKVSKVFSPEHIANSLERQMRNFGENLSIKIKPKRDVSFGKQIGKREEPSILYYDAINVDVNLKAAAISVGGYIKSVKIIDSDPELIHAYINFELEDKKVSVLISHNRYTQDVSTRKFVENVRETWQKTPNNKKCVCICFGWIKCVEKGFNVVPVNLDSLLIGYK